MIIRLIQQKVPLSSKIRIILKTGQEITGNLREIGEFYITLHDTSGDAVITEDMIGAWKTQVDDKEPLPLPEEPIVIPPRPPGNNVPPSVRSPQKTPTNSSTMGTSDNNETLPPEDAPPASTITITYPVEVTRYETNLMLRFKTIAQNAVLKPLPPNFTLLIDKDTIGISRGQISNLRQEWNKFQNQYEYAIKTKEPGRLDVTIAGYEVFLKAYSNMPKGWFNLGCLCLQTGRLDKAIEAFELAAVYADTPEILHNLAVTYLKNKDEAGALGALQRLFHHTSPSNSSNVWHQFLNLVLQFHKVDMLFEFLKEALDQNRDTDVRLILDSTIFILSSYGWSHEARSLIAFALRDISNPKEMIECYSSILDRLKAAGPTLLYQRQQQSLTAVNIRQQAAQGVAQGQKEIQTLLAIAEDWARQGKYIQAIAQIDKVLASVPDHIEAKQRKLQYTNAMKAPSPFETVNKNKIPALPTGQGLYAQAKHAQLVEKDFAKAERLLRLAIEKKENSETAVKDLASLLQQQSRAAEAVKLLEGYLEFATDQLRILNLLASIHQHLNSHAQAIIVLEKILRMTPSGSRAKVLKQIGYCQVKSRQFEPAEETLVKVQKLNPQDATVKKWLDELRQAKRTGQYSLLDETIIVTDLLTDFNPSLSKFLAFYLERCEYQGVAEARIASRSFSEDDLKKLRGLIEGAGQRRPRVRAQYNLSASRLLMDLDTEDEMRFRQYMFDYSADMGRASLAEQKHVDVAFAYFAEAFAIAPERNRKLRESLSQVIMLHYATREAILDDRDRLPTPEESLNEAFKRSKLGTPLTESLLELSLLNHSVIQFISQAAMSDERLRAQIQANCLDIIGIPKGQSVDALNFTEILERSREYMRYQHQAIIDELVFLQSQVRAIDSVQTQIERVKILEQKLKQTLDRQRLRTIAEILGHMYDYIQQQSYVERERLYTIIKKRVQELINEIEDSPTKHSLEMYRTYMLSLDKTLEEHFTRVQQVAEPEQLECTLSIDSYIPDTELNIECQITVTNPPGKSPASALVIEIQDSPTGDFIALQRRIPVSEALPGGKSVTCAISINVTEKAKTSQVFNLYYQLSYTTRTGRQIEMTNLTLPVRLYPDTEFVEIKNPYATYAEGGTVKQEKMFYGREPMIQNLLATIRNSPTNKSLVIYGQKRTGKSSVLYHLKQRLIKEHFTPPVIPVDFSVGDIVDDISVITFLYRILQCLEAAFDDFVDRGYPAVTMDRPTLAQLAESPQLVFHDQMAKLHKTLASFPAYQGAKILLLIDEFSYIYGGILRGKIPDTFMKFWKALLEKGYFGSVLVGQDIMRQFIERFPNEFQVAQSQRVSYLTPDDAYKLMVDPIRIPESDESRYRGVALDRLLALTAGNPFYIQIFCARLVDYMNRKKAIYLTDAHIDRVKDELINGHNNLTSANFDNLINAGAGVDTIPDQDTLNVLRDIALATRIQTYCYRSEIACTTTLPIEVILDDLERREVIEKQGPSVYRIRVELFKEWLLAHQ